MNNEFENDHPAQAKISKLYQGLKVEEPSSQLDKSILAQAKLQLESQASKGGKHASQNTIAKSTWRRWQWPTSVAASVLLLSLIFIDQYAFFTDNQKIYPDVAPINVEAFSAPTPLQSEAEIENRARENTENDMDMVQVMGQKLVKDSLANNKQSELQHAQQFATARRAAPQAKVPMETAATKENQIHIANIEIARLQNELKVKQAELALFENKQLALMTDKALAELNESGSSIANAAAKRQDLEFQVNQLQAQLFMQMHNKLAIQPDWQAEQGSLDLLSPQQQAQWAKQNIKERKE